ncbi:MAG: hypothetical protein DHS20C13_02580 [Thermodesulfobacteriota bacterium]|nr:MAG: hypothetical protein DHS20C13_02580 [Thermodesulfobacteriota bacterium]
MAAKKVVQYEAEWNTETDAGHIRMKYEDGSKFQWEGQDKAEFKVILQILQHDTDPYVIDDKIYATGLEEPGKRHEVD